MGEDFDEENADGPEDSIRMANARLIVSAPKLLEMVKELMTGHSMLAEAKARKLIDQVEGR